MYINKKGKNQAEEKASQRADNISNFSELIQNRIRLRINPSTGRSPIDSSQNPKEEEKSNLDSGPEIMYIDYNQTDRRNPMMDYSDARQSWDLNVGVNQPNYSVNKGHNSRNSILTNIRNEIGGSDRDRNKLVHAPLPVNLGLEAEKPKTVINMEEQALAYSPKSKIVNEKNKKKPSLNYFNMPFNPNTFSNFNNLNEYSNQSSNLNTTKSEVAQTYISDSTRKRNFVHIKADSGKNYPIIIKRMSPNRNTDVNFDSSLQRDADRIQQQKRLELINERNNPKFNPDVNQRADNSIVNLQTTATESGNDHIKNVSTFDNQINQKPDYSLDTNEQMNPKYTHDLNRIIKFKNQFDNFKKYHSPAIVADLPREGNLYTTRTHTISPITKHQLEDKKQAVKQINKLSSILIKDAKSPQNKSLIGENLNTTNYITRTGTVRSTSSDFQSRSYTRKNVNTSTSPLGKFIRVTMAMLSSKGPNCEDRILTRQMRFEKGGVVDLTQPSAKNRSAPKKIQMEVKKAFVRSPRASTEARFIFPRISNKETENAAKTIQSWWRGILRKYKEIVDKSIVIQKSWRRYFVRKNLYNKLSAFYFYAYLFDKLENVMRKHNLLAGFETLYNLNAEKYNALKYLRNVIKIQRAVRRFLKLKKQIESEKRIVSQSKSRFINQPVKLENMRALSQGKLLAKPLKDQKALNEENRLINLIKAGPNKRRIIATEADIENKSPNVNYYRTQLTFGDETRRTPKEKQGLQGDEAAKLSEKLVELRNKFFQSSVLNATRKSFKAQLNPFLNKWRESAGLSEKLKTDAGKKLAAKDITKAIIKKKYDLLLHNLRKVAEKPHKTVALSKGANELFNVFEHRKQEVFNDLMKNIFGEKQQKQALPENFIYKILGMLLNKTSSKILNRKILQRYRLWKNKAIIAPVKIKEAEVLVNSIKLPIHKVLKEVYPKFIKGLYDLRSNKNLKSLARLVTHKASNFRNINLPYFFNKWRECLNQKQIENLVDTIMRKMIVSLNNKRNTRSLSKRFIFWAAKAEESTSVDYLVSQSQAQSRQLSAAAKLVPALSKYSKSKAAELARNPILNFIKTENRKAALRKCFKITPFLEKYQLQKHFNKLKNFEAESQKINLRNILFKTLYRNIIGKYCNEVLRKKLNQWKQCLSEAIRPIVPSLQAVDKLKRSLQRKFFLLPKEALEGKVQKRNIDWALMFLIEYRKQFLRRGIRECIIKWRNNYLRQMVNEKMKEFYAKSLLQFRRRFCFRILTKKFSDWRVNNEEMKKDLLVSSARNINNRVKNIYLARIKDYFAHLIERMGYKGKVTKHQVALGIIVNLTFNRDLKDLEKQFRRWNKNIILSEVSELRANLTSKILENLINKREKNYHTDKINEFFNKWKNIIGQEGEKIQDLYAFIRRCIPSSKFHNKMIRKEIDNLVQIAKHYHQLRKEQALKIGNFMGSVLMIYRRMNIMKRQKALFEVFKRMNFYEKMGITLASNKWRIKTVLINSNEKATILQDFIRKIFKNKREKAALVQKANKFIDNFKKRYALRKINNASKVKNIASLIAKLLNYIPQEFKKFNLNGAMSAWNQKAQSLRKSEAADKIINLFRRFAARNFVYKLQLKKHLLEQIIRKSFKTFVNQKIYNITEWLRNCRLLELRENAIVSAKWVQKRFDNYKKTKSNSQFNKLIRKKQLKDSIDTLKKLAKTTRLIDTIKNVSCKNNGILLWKGLKHTYLTKSLTPLLTTSSNEFRSENLKDCTEKWKSKVFDLKEKAAKRIQSYARMLLNKLKIQRELKKKKLTLRIIFKIYWEDKLVKQGYLNQWLNIIKNDKINKEINTIARVIKAKNEKSNYDRAIFANKMRKVFRNYFVSNVKNVLSESAKSIKKTLNALIKNDSNFEKRYALNNLLEFGNHSLRKALIHKLTGEQDKLVNNSLIREAVEKWRNYTQKVLEFALKLQKMRRGKVYRDFFNRAKKLNELFSLLSFKYLGDKPLKAVRINQWANKIRYFETKQNAIIIQKYLRKNLDAILLKKLQDLLDKGFQKHFLKSVLLMAKLRKLKESIRSPIKAQAFDSIRRRFVFLRIKDSLVKTIEDLSDLNIKTQKEEGIKLWRNKIYKITENKKFAALLITAAVKGKIKRLKIKRLQEISEKLKLIISKALYGEEGIKRCLIHHWSYNSKRIQREKAQEILCQNAKGILEKIKTAEKEHQMNRKNEGFEKLSSVLRKNVLGDLMERMINRNKIDSLHRLNEIYCNNYTSLATEAIKSIKFYGFYRINLIRRIQKYWKNKFRLWKFTQKVLLMRRSIQLASDKELAQKRAFVLLWRFNLRKLEDDKKANVLQSYYRNILDKTRKLREEAESKIKNIATRCLIKRKIIGGLRNLKSMMKMKQIDNLILKKHYDFLRLKTMILYTLKVFSGQFSKLDDKVKSNFAQSWKNTAMKLREVEAANKIIRTLREIKNRRRDNRLREILIPLVLSKIGSEKQTKIMLITEWSRTAQIMKMKENMNSIDNFLIKKKRAFDLAKKWNRLLLRLHAENAVIASKQIKDRVNLKRKTEPFIDMIKKLNVVNGGSTLIYNLKRKSIYDLIHKALSSSCGIGDKEKLKSSVILWLSNTLKMNKRERALGKAVSGIQQKYFENCLRIVIGAYNFIRYQKLTELVLLYDAMRRIRARADSIYNIRKFREKVTVAEEFHIKSGSEAFKEKFYKLFVYKLIANMGAIFLKLYNRVYKPAAFNAFIENLKLQDELKSAYQYTENIQRFNVSKALKAELSHEQLTAEQRKQIEFYAVDEKTHTLKCLGILMSVFRKATRKRKQELCQLLFRMSALAKLQKVFRANKAWAFGKLKFTISNSLIRANTYVLLRGIYLNKVLKEILSANRFLILSHMVKLASVTKQVLNARFLLKYLRTWKFKSLTRRIKHEKIGLLKDSLDKFAATITQNLFEGPDSITNQYGSFNRRLDLYSVPKMGLLKKVVENAVKKYEGGKDVVRNASKIKIKNIPSESRLYKILNEKEKHVNLEHKDTEEKDNHADETKDTIKM